MKKQKQVQNDDADKFSVIRKELVEHLRYAEMRHGGALSRLTKYDAFLKSIGIETAGKYVAVDVPSKTTSSKPALKKRGKTRRLSNGKKTKTAPASLRLSPYVPAHQGDGSAADDDASEERETSPASGQGASSSAGPASQQGPVVALRSGSTLADRCAQVMGFRTMKVAEIISALRAANMMPDAVRPMPYIRTTLRKHADRFQRVAKGRYRVKIKRADLPKEQA